MAREALQSSNRRTLVADTGIRAWPAASWQLSSTQAQRFRCHRWVQRTLQLQRMGLERRLEQHLMAAVPEGFKEHLLGGPAWLRLGLLETLPIGVLAGQLAELTAHWRRWDLEAWGRCLPLLASVDPAAALAEVEWVIGHSDGLPRGPGVPGMVKAVQGLGAQARETALLWAGSARQFGVPLEYLWSGWFGMLASVDAPGLAQMLLQTFQVFAPGAREVDVVLRSVFEGLLPNNPSFALVLGMKTGAGYLLEDLPELYEPSSVTRKVDELLVAPTPCDSAAVLALLQTASAKAPGPAKLALQLVRLSTLGRWSTHAERFAHLGLAVVAASCERQDLNPDELSLADLLSLLAVDLPELPNERTLIDAAARRVEARHQDLLERELEQSRGSQGLLRLIDVARTARTTRHIPFMMSLLGRNLPAQAAWTAAGALAEAGPSVVPELERAFDGMDFEGKALALDVMGLLDCAEAGACLSRKLRGALSDTELLDRWALAASWLGHHDLVTAAKRWAACAPWPLQAMIDASES